MRVFFPFLLFLFSSLPGSVSKLLFSLEYLFPLCIVFFFLDSLACFLVKKRRNGAYNPFAELDIREDHSTYLGNAHILLGIIFVFTMPVYESTVSAVIRSGNFKRRVVCRRSRMKIWICCDEKVVF